LVRTEYRPRQDDDVDGGEVVKAEIWVTKDAIRIAINDGRILSVILIALKKIDRKLSKFRISLENDLGCA
jgi:hypothetical protein